MPSFGVSPTPYTVSDGRMSRNKQVVQFYVRERRSPSTRQVNRTSPLSLFKQSVSFVTFLLTPLPPSCFIAHRIVEMWLHSHTRVLSILCFRLTTLCFGATHAPPYNVTTISQFPLPSWVENLAFRSSGQLLATLGSTAELYLVDPSGDNLPVTPTLLHSFAGKSSVSGIVELGHDNFYMAVGNFSLETGKSVPGTWDIWKAQFNTDCPKISTETIETPPRESYTTQANPLFTGSRSIPTAPRLAMSQLLLPIWLGTTLPLIRMEIFTSH